MSAIQTELSRDLGLTSCLAIGVGTMIAAGIFSLSGLAVRDVGSAALLAFLLAGLVAACTALSYCEFSSLYPESGEGYLYCRKTFPQAVAFAVGWCLVLGYASSCGFYLASLSVYFQEFVWHLPLEQLAGLLGLGLLVLLNLKGTRESGRFQVVVTAAKVVLLMWLVAGGLGSFDPSLVAERFSTDVARIGQTAALVFITFFGFSAIAASAGEVANPTTTIPRAIFLSMLGVTVLYSLVVLVLLGANLTEYSEAAMGLAARRFLGPIGGMVIVAGALFSMISAANASVLAGSRVVLTMSQLGHLPEFLRLVNPVTQTPVGAVLAVGVGIALFILGLGLEDLAHFADAVLLLALSFVNAALIWHRRRFPALERGFRVPLVPLIPGLGIVANLALLVQALRHPEPRLLLLVALAAGAVAFVALKSREVGRKPTSRAVYMGPSSTQPSPYPILVPLANPVHVPQLVGLAATIARERGGTLFVLTVVQVPEQTPLDQADYSEREAQLLELACRHGQELGVEVTPLVRIGHSVARAILEAARVHGCRLTVVGWKGAHPTARRTLGDVLDEVATHAGTDLLTVRLSAPLEGPRRVLLPHAGGPHELKAEEYAADLARAEGGHVTLCTVVEPDAGDQRLQEVQSQLAEALQRLSARGVRASTRILRGSDVVQALAQEASEHDTVLVGASARAFLPQVIYGTTAESLARTTLTQVILVRAHHPVKALLGRLLAQ